MKTNDPSYILRIDKKTGKTLWRVERPTVAIRESPDSYSTPQLLKYNDKVEIVILGGDCVTGHDPATGKELWRGNGLNPVAETRNGGDANRKTRIATLLVSHSHRSATIGSARAARRAGRYAARKMSNSRSSLGPLIARMAS